MEKGTSTDTRLIFSFLGKDKKEEIDFFANDASQEEYHQIKSAQEVEDLFGEITFNFLLNSKQSELNILKSYTSYTYKELNAVMRNTWNYEENGRLTPEIKQDYLDRGERMTKLIRKFSSLEKNIKTYRGTSLRQFKAYGITSLADLKSMVGNYMYDPSFTSTSLVRESSLLGMENFFTGERNIEIEYLIPATCKDGAILLDSYSNEECEYLINSSNLSKITKVEIDEENKTAFVQAVLIPKSLWDPYQIEEEMEIKM